VGKTKLILHPSKNKDKKDYVRGEFFENQYRGHEYTCVEGYWEALKEGLMVIDYVKAINFKEITYFISMK